MDGSNELRLLAHLLCVSATTARDVATLRNNDVEEIFSLSKQLEALASCLERIANKPSRNDLEERAAS